MVKILFLVRPDINKIKAGDTIQIYKLKSALEKKGLRIDISNEIEPALDQYDLVHLFNILRIEVSARQCFWAKERGKPLILTPIYWNMEEYLSQQTPDRLQWWYRGQPSRERVLNMADLILPNAEEEWKKLKKDFKLGGPHQIIYNGVDPIFLKRNKLKRKIDLLSVGRIHSRKNQLKLIRSLKGTDVSLTIIGDVNDPAYYRQCQEAAENVNVTFIKGMGQSLLAKYYQQARLHVMVSWYDTPGLVNLEAGLAGCNLVMTDRGTGREYFQNYALYADPGDENSIRKKVQEGIRKPLNDFLVQHIMANFTWEAIAQKTKTIYIEFLSRFI